MNSKYAFLPDETTGCLTEQDTKRYISRLFFAVAAFEVAGYVVAKLLGLIVRFVCNNYAPDLLLSGDFVGIANHLISMLAMYCIAMPVLCIVASPLPKMIPQKKKMGAKSWWCALCICFTIMYVGNYISTIILSIMEGLLQHTTSNPVETMTAESSIIIDIVFVVILAPILEEILFRKIICNKLLPLGEGYAIVLSATIFGLGHGNFYQFAYAFFIGIIFALIYVKTGKLRYSIIYHMIFNLVGGVIAPWLVEFADLEGAMEILEQAEPDLEEALICLAKMIPMLIYVTIYMGVIAVGVVVLIRALVKKKIKLEKGALMPYAENKVLTVLCTVGTAVAVTVYAFNFLLSLIQ
jgi:membrane protease YdiL (CAAX protease family)